MSHATSQNPRNRCLLSLGVAALLLGALWLAGYLLISAIYHGHAGDFLNALIQGQSKHALAEYHADFNRLFAFTAGAILAPLLVCSLLPRAVREKVGSLAAGVLCCFRTDKQPGGRSHFRTPAALVIASLLGTIAYQSVWGTASTRIPRSYPPGEARLLAGPADCNGQHCYELEIHCRELSRTEKVSLKVGQPVDQANTRGTILFYSGWTGNYWWDWDTADDASATDEDRRIEASHKTIIADLQAAGFRTVQIKWDRGWFIAVPDVKENPPLLACNPAAVAQWVYDNIHQHAADQAYCATGHSNGATALGYMLSRYKLAELFSLVVLESGPNWARLDYSCIEDPVYPDLLNTDNGRTTIDMAYGFPNDGTGSCARQDKSWLEVFRRTSLVAEDEWSYHYPRTHIALLLSDDDDMVAAKHARYYYERLLAAGSPLVTFDRVTGGGHVPSSTPAGTQLLTSTLQYGCHPRK